MSGEKTENATEYRLSKAKKDGRVSKSLEFNAAVMLACIIALSNFDIGFLAAFSEALNYSLSVSSFGWTAVGLHSILLGVSQRLGDFMLTFLLIIVLVSVVVNIVQIGFVFSVKSIAPDFSRIDPAKGFEKIFNMKSFYDTFRILSKLTIGCFLYYFWVVDFLKSELLSGWEGGEIVDYSIREFRFLAFMILGVIVISAVVDVAYTRRKYLRDLRMTKHEVKEESKSKEGDPEIKSRRKKYMNEIIKNSAVYKKVELSDFVIVNPTHLAVLIKYDRKSMMAPKVIGKARGGQVYLVKLVARRKNITVVKNKILARKIYFASKVDAYIPLDSYEEVAGLYKETKPI